MAGQKFTLTFDANLNVSQMKGALGQIQSTLNGLHLPQNMTRGLTNTLANLEKELRNFEVAAGKDLQQKGNFNALQKTAEKISSLFADIKIQARDLGLHNDLDKFFPKEVVNNITKANDALNDYKQALKQITTAQNREQSKLRGAVAKQTVAQSDLEAAKEQLRIQQELQKINLTNIFKAAKITAKDIFNPQEIEQAIAKIKELQEKAQNVQNNIGPNGKTYNYADSIKAKYAKQYAELEQLIAAYQQMPAAIQNAENALDKAQSAYDKATDTVRKYREQIKLLEQDNSTKSDAALQKLWDDISKLNGIDISKYGRTLEEAKRALSDYEQAAGKDVQDALNSLNNIINQNSHAYDENAEAVKRDTERYREFDTQARDIGSLKSRIQYFFGLNNAINLVKRTMREAFNTIKELDKAMTETAVVTDFSVGDMWAQLPDYTKRANELGVTTKAAYEAATLYYQQGLKTNEVMAMSNETLKMARIAGLDAAVATDRMTNAIRGFNMEINTTNAQRIDDVYSKLAAISASNVDEISTAMTKVASLAHSANMEFETTAAFLAQIIETTRESAETAGTALKTVVARFSEVKKLVSEGELKGNDEEGELIDVNKVSSALRTAGIDLNKYFLGEVGLDDIFMELASKWDSLTTMQQRYIATQAAGSRQQSRFIALMSDYARTQELVGEAYNANGAAAKQFAKTQESLESKLARLKNAWNEFSMGILNSDLVKIGVDLLTNILKGINDLTSGFGLLDKGVGGVINSVSKLILLFGGLNVGKTLLSGLSTSITNIGLTAAGKAPFDVARAMSTGAVGANATGTLANLAGRGKGGALLAGFLNPFAGIGKVGKAAWGGMQTLGTTITAALGIGSGGAAGAAASGGMSWLAGGLTGTAAGIAGIATALGAVSAAALGVVAAYKAWEKYTPSGQLHVARKHAEEMQKVADEAKASSQSIQQLKNSYEQYSQAVEQASTLEERRNAIQERNNAILEAIDKNPDYARFLDTDFDVTGELVLTLDADKVTEAAIEAAKEATKASIDSYFANADVYFKEAQAYSYDMHRAKANLLNNLDDEGNAVYSVGSQFFGGAEVVKAQKTAAADLANATVEFNRLTEASRKLAQLGYASMIQLSDKKLGEQLGADIEQSLAETLSRVFQYTEKQIDQKTLEALEDQLIGGTLDTNILSAVVADGLSISLAKTDLGDDTKLREIFGIAEDAINDFADAIGEEPKYIYDVLRARAKEIQAFQKQQRTNIFESMLKNNAQALNIATIEFINSLNSDDLKTALKLLTSSGNLLGEQGQQVLHGNLQGLLESDEAKSLINLFNSINLDNPIRAFQKLTKVEETASETVKQYINYIKQANSEVFSRSGRIQSFFQTEDYEKLSESVAKLREENGKITSKNIEELSNDCGDLKTLLDDTEISANQLAEAINAINDGAPMEGLTDAVLDAFDATADLDDLIWDLHDSIQNFNAGLDYGEGTDFIVNLAGQLKELAENFELGNQQTENIYDYIFGDGAYQRFLKNNPSKNIEELANLLVGQANAAVEMASEESYGFMNWAADKGILGISRLPDSENGDNFLWDIKDKTSEELRDAVKDAFSKETGQEVSDEFAWSLVEGAMAHMKDLRQELETNDYNAAIEEFVKKTGEGSTATQAELQTLATAYNKTIEEVSTSVGELGIKIPTIIKFTDEFGNPLDTQALVDQLENQKNSILQAAASGLKNGKIVYDYDILVKGLLDTGMDQGQADEVINAWIEKLGDATLGKTVKFQDLKINAEGNITATQVEANVTADSVQGLDAAAKAQMENGVKEADYELAAQKLADLNLQPFEENLVTAFQNAADRFQEIINGLNINFENKDTGITKDNVSSEIQSTTVSVDADTTKYESTVEQASNKNRVIPVDANTSEFETQLVGALKDSSTKGTTILTGDLNGVSPSQLQQNIMGAITSAGQIGADNIRVSLDGQHFTIFIDYVETNRPSAPGAAAGGFVQSLAGGSGNRFLQPGFALTGEEAPEIVWNKELGYAYITGAHGPEFRMLQPGDRVFNAQETSRILHNSSFANGGYFGSYATGGWNRTRISERRGQGSGRSGGSGGSGGSDNSNPTVWENELDWLYNLMEDISELERVQTKLAEKHDRYLSDISKTGRDLYNVTQDQLNVLYTQRDNQREALVRRRQEMAEQIGISGYGNYVWWNDEDQTIEIDWEAIEAIQDKDTYDEVTDLISKVEKIQDQMDTARDSLWDIEGQIKELEDRYLQEFTEFQQRILDAVVRSYQDTIDNLTSLNDTLNDTNASILESLQKEIEYSRQIRDNTDTENNIADMEARLAYLRRDTTGASEGEVRELERQLNESRQDYSDTLIDQQLERLSEANDLAAEQRQQQITLMTEQLEYWQESGALWGEVTQLLADGISEDGSLIHGTELEQILQNAEGWRAMSEQQKEVWGNDLITAANQAGAYLLKMSEGFDSLSAGVWAMLPSSSVTSQKLQYATGGMNIKTGWAWLDGTANDPEYVLNARQTDAFLRLADILPSMLGSGNSTTNNLGGNVYVELTMNVGEIGSDYDVDRMVDRVKSDIYDASNYRNVNSVNFSR